MAGRGCGLRSDAICQAVTDTRELFTADGPFDIVPFGNFLQVHNNDAAITNL